MKRTQIQLDEQTYQLARARAFERGISVAALVREALGAHLNVKHRLPLRVEELKSFAVGQSEPSPFDPISERHDEALAEDFR